MLSGLAQGNRKLVLVRRTRKPRDPVAFLVQAPCGLSDCLSNMRTEGRDGARWPWLLSRPDRGLRCPDGRVVGAMVMSTESVETPFTIELWVIVAFSTTFGDSCWVFSALKCELGTGILHGCAHIVLLLVRVSVVSENKEDNIVGFVMIARDREWQHIALAVTIGLSNEHLIRFI